MLACHDAAGGNPFLTRELLGALERDRISPTAAAAGAGERTGATHGAARDRAAARAVARLVGPAGAGRRRAGDRGAVAPCGVARGAGRALGVRGCRHAGCCGDPQTRSCRWSSCIRSFAPLCMTISPLPHARLRMRGPRACSPLSTPTPSRSRHSCLRASLPASRGSRSSSALRLARRSRGVPPKPPARISSGRSRRREDRRIVRRCSTSSARSRR